MSKERYCNIECKSLEDIKKTCERHILNTKLSRMDLIENYDLTTLDNFYLDEQAGMWNDLLQDVNKMLEEKNV